MRPCYAAVRVGKANKEEPCLSSLGHNHVHNANPGRVQQSAPTDLSAGTGILITTLLNLFDPQHLDSTRTDPECQLTLVSPLRTFSGSRPFAHSAMVKHEDVGIVGGVNVNLSILMTMVAFLSIALYNVIETTFLVFAVFKQRKGLYFWSFLISNWGIVPHGVGFVLKFFRITTLDLLSSAIVGVGWACMVLGQSVVLYSRLHLVIQDQTRLRWVLYMIIFDGIIIGIPLFVLAMGANSKHTAHFLPGFLIYDKVQLVVISAQETIISLIYIYETIQLLRQGSGRRKGPVEKLLRHLIFVNIVVLILDITLLAIQFSGHYEIQTTYKTAVYSVKLKIEFSVLNRLVNLVKHRDLLSSPRTHGDNTLYLSRWTEGNATRKGISNDLSIMSKIEESGRSGESRKEASTSTAVLHLNQAETGGMGNDYLYPQPPESQSGSLNEARHPSTIV